jgi:hypothetical protein
MGNDDDEPEEVEDDESEGTNEEDDTGEDNAIVGNGFVEETAVELEGSRTRRGRRYDGGGALVTVSVAHSSVRARDT